MAWSTVHWKSLTLGKQTTAQVLLPDTGSPPFATLYLLHGLGDDSTAWMRRSRIEHHVRELPLIVVMPDGYRGFYTTNEAGPDHAHHIGVELPAWVERHFHAKAERGARAIGGLSMGGYGALRVGLGYADKFCSVNSHSGAVGWGDFDQKIRPPSPETLAARAPDLRVELRRVFGADPRGSGHDIAALAERAKTAGRLPELLLDCGTEDFLLNDNRQLHAQLDAGGVPHVYREFPGDHTWDYWDDHVREALAFHAANLRLAAG